MRHRKRRTRFGRQSSHRSATLRSLTRNLLLHQRIRTTRTKAKEAKRLIERLITTAKKDSLTARRRAFAVLGDRTLVSKLFKDIIPLFADRNSGFTRIIPYNFRRGDGANMVFLELTERKVEEKPKPPKKVKKLEKPSKPQERKREKEELHKAAPEISQKLKEEKTVEEIRKEKAKDEVKKIEKQKGFIKKVKGFFRRRTKM